MPRRKVKSRRKRIGRVSYYFHHHAWYLYYRERGRPVRRRVADSEAVAERIAAEVNSKPVNQQETSFEFSPVEITDLRQRFLNYHEIVRESSLATVRRYRAATQHLVDFSDGIGDFNSCAQNCYGRVLAWLRKRKVSQNGHSNTSCRPLSDRGLRYILEVCRSLYSYAAKHRHLPP